MVRFRGLVSMLRLLLAGLVMALGVPPRLAAGQAPGSPPPPGVPQLVAGEPFMPTYCEAQLVSNTVLGSAIPDNGTITYTVPITQPVAYAVYPLLYTNLNHTRTADLDVTLISPSGTEVTITTDNPNVPTNTLVVFTDIAAVPITDGPGPGPSPIYLPEEAMGAFRGEPVVGDWLVVVTDDAAGAAGSTAGFIFGVYGATRMPVTHTVAVSNTTPQSIPDAAFNGSLTATITSTLNLSTPGTSLLDLKLRTHIEHTFASDLVIYLTAPNGVTTTISTRNGGGMDNVFNGTLWDDQGGAANPPGPVTDNVFANNVVETPLVPEGALSRFTALDPNGTWTLTVGDRAHQDSGQLTSWELIATTAYCPVQVYLPSVRK